MEGGGGGRAVSFFPLSHRKDKLHQLTATHANVPQEHDVTFTSSEMERERRVWMIGAQVLSMSSLFFFSGLIAPPNRKPCCMMGSHTVNIDLLKLIC